VAPTVLVRHSSPFETLTCGAVQFRKLMSTGVLEDIVNQRGDGFFRTTPIAISQDEQTWAMTWIETDFVPRYLPAQGPRFLFRNVTIWSSPSYDTALPYIRSAISMADDGNVWRDTRTMAWPQVPSAQDRKPKVWVTVVVASCGATGALLLTGVPLSHFLPLLLWTRVDSTSCLYCACGMGGRGRLTACSPLGSAAADVRALRCCWASSTGEAVMLLLGPRM
jgi:hypothetical protein